jgi:hypothetical protein
VKTVIRNVACNLAKPASNLLIVHKKEIGYAELKVNFVEGYAVLSEGD